MNTIEMQMNSNTMTQDSVIEPATTTTNDQDLNSLITRLMQTATATTSTEPNQARFVWRRNTRQWVKIVQTPRRKPFRGNASETANG